MNTPNNTDPKEYCEYEDNELWEALEALADWIDRLDRDPYPEEELDRLISSSGIVKVKRRW